jgi:hypothetical protein
LFLLVSGAIILAFWLAGQPAGVGTAVGFLLWGVGAGIIVDRQKRLMPIIIAHFMSNLPFGLIPLLFILGGA